MAALLLTVVTIVLAVVAFLISVGAFFGYGAIREAVTKATKENEDKIKILFEQERAEDQTQLAEYVLKLEERVAAFQSTIREEMLQAKGLESGAQADAFARAASGRTDSKENG